MPTVPVWLPGLVTVGAVFRCRRSRGRSGSRWCRWTRCACIGEGAGRRTRRSARRRCRRADPGALVGVLLAAAMSVQPPAGFWSVMVSAYSWPSTIVKPSSVPAEPGVDEVLAAAGARVGDVRQVGERDVAVRTRRRPRSVAVPVVPGAEAAGLVLKPSGWVPVGERMTYWALRLAAAVVLPKWRGGVDRLAAELVAGGLARRRRPSCRTRHRPARRRSGSRRAARSPGRSARPTATPSQYCVITPDHSSPLVPRPLNSSCSARRLALRVAGEASTLPLRVGAGGAPLRAPEDEVDLRVPVVTPMPSMPPP